MNSTTSGTGFIQSSYRKRDSRTAFLTLTFKLGSIDYKQKDKRKNNGNDNNDNGDDTGY